ncbi:hypothetical protein Tco_1326226 [Tanacetum coccineum]
MEAHCVNLKLKYQNQALKKGQHGQFSKVKSIEAKAKHDIDVIETINIELEHKVAKLLKENETLEKHYKELPRLPSQVDVNNRFANTAATTHYLPKERESVVAKPHLMIAPSSSRWVPTGKIFTSSTTKVDSEPPNGLNEDITNLYECEQTLNVSVAMTSDQNSSELGIHDHSNEQSSSKLVLKFVPPANRIATSRQELELLFHHHITILRYKRRCCSLIPAESDSLPYAYAQTTKTNYKHQDLRIKKAQELKTKTSANYDIKDNSSETKLRERLSESFQEDTKYEHIGQDTRSQGGKDDQDKQGKYLEISKSKTKSKDNDRGSRSKITQHEGTSLQHNKD